MDPDIGTVEAGRIPRDATVAVAMSGGVDSSVAAARCVAAGFKTVGITLAMWPRNRVLERDRGCCSVDAVEDARRVAAKLGIPHYTWNLEEEFTGEVIAGFEAGYLSGQTPNPCIVCNSKIKFGALLQRAKAAGADFVATGHYARVHATGGETTLHRSVERSKDQSYTLHRLNQRQLSAAYFPLGDVASKAGVREEADALGLGTAHKAESQELCFVDTTLSRHLQEKLAGRFAPGPILDGEGQRIGTHRGLPFYTVGQRARLGVEPRVSNATPLYVLRIDAANNAITAGPRELLERATVTLEQCSWINARPRPGEQFLAQWRAHGRPVPVEVAEIDARHGVVRLHGLEPLFQLAPGQAMVLYDQDRVAGGGPIAEAA